MGNDLRVAIRGLELLTPGAGITEQQAQPDGNTIREERERAEIDTGKKKKRIKNRKLEVRKLYVW